MMDVSPSLEAALNLTANAPVDLYELQLDSGSVFFADRDITWGGHHYLAYVNSRSTITRYMNGQFDQVSVEFSNVDTTIAQMVAENEIEGRILIIRTVFPTVTDDCIVRFFGVLQRPGACDETKFTLTALDYMGGVDFDCPTRLFSPFCTFEFKGIECGYSGPNADCDHSWSNCNANANTPRFGGFRFIPKTGFYQYTEITTERFLLFFSRKKKNTVNVAFNAMDDTPYDIPIPIVLGRVQIQGIPVEHVDEGSQTKSLHAFCGGPIEAVIYPQVNNTFVEDFDLHLGGFGGDPGQDIDPRFPDSYAYNLFAYIGVTLPSDVQALDPAPSVLAVVCGSKPEILDASGAVVSHDWTDNPIWNTRHLLTLPLAQGGLGVPADWIDGVDAFSEAAYCAEAVDDGTNDQYIYQPTSIADGINFFRFKSTGVIGQDPAAAIGAYFGFVPGVDDDTSRNPAIVPVRRLTLNIAIAQQQQAADLLFSKILPAFRGFLTTSKAGQIQIKVEKAAPNATVTTASTAGATEIFCSTPASFAAGCLVLCSPLTDRAEVRTVDHVTGDRVVFTAATTEAHHLDEELLRIAMAFDDSNMVDAPVSWPQQDRQDACNRVTVKYTDVPAGFEQRSVVVNDYDNQARVHKVNNVDIDGSGIDSFFQAYRIGQWALAMRRSLNKFASFRGDVKASRLEIGDVIAWSAVEHGSVCVPLRVVELGFAPEDEVDIVGQLYTSGIYDDVAPQTTVTVPSLFRPILPAKPPMPWKPYGEANEFTTFGYGMTLAVDAANQKVVIGGMPPVNSRSAALTEAPVLDAVGTITAYVSGNLPIGDFVVAGFALDADGKYSPSSNLMKVSIAAAASQLDFKASWPSGAAAYQLFFGRDRDSLVGQWDPIVGTPPASITITSSGGLPPSFAVGGGFGPPDSKFDHFRIRVKKEIHGGRAAVTAFASATETAYSAGVTYSYGDRVIRAGEHYISLVTGNIGHTPVPLTITSYWAPVTFVVLVVPPSPLTVNILAGVRITIVSHVNLPATQPWGDQLIAGNSANGVIILASPMQTNGGDLLMIRTSADIISADTIGDSGLISPWAPAGLEVNEGNYIVRIMFDPTGAATQQTSRALSNTATAYTVEPWRVQPGLGSIFVVEEAAFRVDVPTSPVKSSVLPGIAGPSPVEIGSFPIDDLSGTVVLVMVNTADADESISADIPDEVREIYVPEPAALGDELLIYYP